MKRAAGVDNTARRTWDKEEYAEKAEEREAKAAKDEETAADIKKRKRLERDPLHQGLIVERSALKTREYQLDLASRLGKTQVIGLNTPLNQQAGYFCAVCNCVLRDSQTYLDHINGKYHNRALGMNMNVERSTLEQVRSRLASHRDKPRAAAADEYLPDGIERRVAEAEEAEERARQERRERKREAKEAARARAAGGGGGDGGGDDDDMMALMGFGGFGGSKKS